MPSRRAQELDEVPIPYPCRRAAPERPIEKVVVRVLEQLPEQGPRLGVEATVMPVHETGQDEVELEQSAAAVPTCAIDFGHRALHTVRLTSSSLILPMARVGLSPFGQTSTQFMIV